MFIYIYTCFKCDTTQGIMSTQVFNWATVIALSLSLTFTTFLVALRYKVSVSSSVNVSTQNTTNNSSK